MDFGTGGFGVPRLHGLELRAGLVARMELSARGETRRCAMRVTLRHGTSPGWHESRITRLNRASAVAALHPGYYRAVPAVSWCDLTDVPASRRAAAVGRPSPVG